MVITPVIFLTIVTGVAGMRDLAAVGRVAAKAFAYFLAFSTVALVVGMIVANVIQPGAALHIDPASLDASKVADYAAKAHESTVTGFLTGIIPETLGSALVEGNILQVVFVAILSALP
jgi:aerobic C4-dicarboxylate transport protein